VATFANALACQLGEAFQAINGHAMAMAISAAGE
jgi:hypothetical protein